MCLDLLQGHLTVVTLISVLLVQLTALRLARCAVFDHTDSTAWSTDKDRKINHKDASHSSCYNSGIGSTPVLPHLHVKDPGHSAKSAGSRLQLNTHAPYVCGFAWSDMVHGCMVYTERAETAAVSRGTSHVSVVSTQLGWMFKCLKKRRKKRKKPK